jgi:hypothetical protein
MVRGVMRAVWQSVMSPVSRGGGGVCGMGAPVGAVEAEVAGGGNVVGDLVVAVVVAGVVGPAE